jgi:hypothetical protein
MSLILKLCNKFFENVVRRNLFGPKRKTITGERRKLHTGELDDLYSSPNIIRLMIFTGVSGGACGTFGGEKKCLQNICGKLEERDRLRRPRDRRGNKFKMRLE